MNDQKVLEGNRMSSCRPPRLTGAARVVLALLLAGALPVGAAEDTSPAPANSKERISYSTGYAFGHHLAGMERGGEGVDLESVFRGVLDALSGAEPRMSEAQMREALGALTPTAATSEGQGAKVGAQIPAPPPRAGAFVDDFAALNAKREGVTTLPSGVQYEVLKQGTGRTPGPGDRVAISYEATLSNGIVFDSTGEEDGPLRMRVDEIIVPGLREALMLMKEGDRWRVVIPPNMGFGASGKKLLRKRDLIYEIELVAVEPPEQDTAHETGKADRPATPDPD